MSRFPAGRRARGRGVALREADCSFPSEDNMVCYTFPNYFFNVIAAAVEFDPRVLVTQCKSKYYM